MNTFTIPIQAGRTPLTDDWSISFAGDFCISPRIYSSKDKNTDASSWISPPLIKWLKESNLSIANFEGAIPFGHCKADKIGPSVAMHESCPALLHQMGFNAVSLANNHIMDFGASALLENISTLQANDITVFGAGRTEDDAMTPAVFHVRDHSIAVFGFAEYEFGVAGKDQSGTSWIGHPDALDKIHKASRSYDIVIVIAHGGVEHVPAPPTQRQAQLKRLIDAGATAVVGHHPHVPQGWEIYKGRPIFYSLGNFIFLPWMKHHPSNTWTYITKIHFSKTTPISLEIAPVEFTPETQSLQHIDPESAQKRFDYLMNLSRSFNDQTAHEDWVICAGWLWDNKYKGMLEAALSKGLKNKLRTWLQPAVRRWRRYHLGIDDASDIPIDTWRKMLLVSLLRTESHRWAIETALEAKPINTTACFRQRLRAMQ